MTAISPRSKYHPGMNPLEFATCYDWLKYIESGRAVARKLYPLNCLCEKCGKRQAKNRHHIDGDTWNNLRSNVQLLCGGCHAPAAHFLSNPWFLAHGPFPPNHVHYRGYMKAINNIRARKNGRGI